MRLLRSLVLSLALLLGATACAEGSEIANMIDGQSVGEVGVIDVRSPAEFAAGHVVGALNVDAEASGFRAELDALPRDRVYVVYGDTGHAARTLELMRGLDFGSVTNGGTYEELVDAGVPTER